MRIVCVIVLISLFFSGCTSSYISPTSGPTARLNFENQSDLYLSISHFNGGEECTDGTFISPRLDPYSDRTITIRGGVMETFSFMFHSFSEKSRRLCRFSSSFITEENRTYTATLTVKNNFCTMDLVDESSKVSVEGIVMREMKTPMLSSQGFCNPIEVLNR